MSLCMAFCYCFCHLFTAGDRLKEFAVYVDDQDRDPGLGLGTVCAKVHKIENGATELYKCAQPITGRFVSVVLKHKNSLTICELEVYADLTTAAGETLSAVIASPSCR